MLVTAVLTRRRGPLEAAQYPPARKSQVKLPPMQFCLPGSTPEIKKKLRLPEDPDHMPGRQESHETIMILATPQNMIACLYEQCPDDDSAIGMLLDIICEFKRDSESYHYHTVLHPHRRRQKKPPVRIRPGPAIARLMVRVSPHAQHSSVQEPFNRCPLAGHNVQVPRWRPPRTPHPGSTLRIASLRRRYR